MPEDDDDIDDFKLPPHSNEDADAQLDAKALKLVEEYVGSLNRSKNENTIRLGIRETIVKLGINSLSFQHELTAQKMMDADERRDYMAGRRRMGRILADKQQVLFKDDYERIKKRKEKAKEKATKAAAKAAEAKARSIEAGDTNPKSDPKRGGAGGVKGRAKAKDKPVAGSAADRAMETSERTQRLQETQSQSPGAAPGTLKDAVAASDAALAESIAAAEQTEGGQILDGALEKMKGEAGKPLSQSAQAAKVREELGLDKG